MVVHLTPPETDTKIIALLDMLGIFQMDVDQGVGTLNPTGAAYGANHFVEGITSLVPTDNGGNEGHGDSNDLGKRMDQMIQNIKDAFNDGKLNAPGYEARFHLTANGPRMIAMDASVDVVAPQPAAAATVNLPVEILNGLEKALLLNHMTINMGNYVTCGKGNEYCAERFYDALSVETNTMDNDTNTEMQSIVDAMQDAWIDNVNAIIDDFPNVTGFRIGLFDDGVKLAAQTSDAEACAA